MDGSKSQIAQISRSNEQIKYEIIYTHLQFDIFTNSINTSKFLFIVCQIIIWQTYPNLQQIEDAVAIVPWLFCFFLFFILLYSSLFIEFSLSIINNLPVAFYFVLLPPASYWNLLLIFLFIIISNHCQFSGPRSDSDICTTA